MSMPIAYLLKILDTIKQSTSGILIPVRENSMNNAHTTYASVGMGSSVAGLLVWIAKAFFHVDMPAEAAVAAATILTAFFGRYLHNANPST
jgi:uncharacterized membrane protein YfcA